MTDQRNKDSTIEAARPNFFVSTGHGMPAWPNKRNRPLDVMFWRLDLAGNGSNVDISYGGAFKYTMTNRQSINDVLTLALNGKLPDPTEWEKPDYDMTDPRNFLSIRLNRLCYLVFILGPGNWRFSRKKVPFKISRSKKEYYHEARVAWLEGGSIKVDEKPDRIDARVGYFIARADDDYAEHNQKFHSSFNIYVDLIPGRQSLSIPITVDPDVGYPGGNNIDGGP